MILDHLVWVAPDLGRATAEWRAASFDVRPGGHHREQPTRNVLAPLGAGAYLELLGPSEPEVMPGLDAHIRNGTLDVHLRAEGSIPRRFLGLLARSRGMADWCLATDDLDGAVERARSGGLVVPDPEAMSRVRPDGQTISWRLAVPDDPELPFLVEDVTPRALRVPEHDAEAGCPETTVRAVSVYGADPKRTARGLRALVGVPGAVGRLRVGDVEVTVSPQEAGSAGRLQVVMARADGSPDVALDGVTWESE